MGECGVVGGWGWGWMIENTPGSRVLSIVKFLLEVGWLIFTSETVGTRQPCMFQHLVSRPPSGKTEKSHFLFLNSTSNNLLFHSTVH